MPCLARVRLLVVMMASANASGPHAVSVAWHYLGLALTDLIKRAFYFALQHKKEAEVEVDSIRLSSLPS